MVKGGFYFELNCSVKLYDRDVTGVVDVFFPTRTGETNKNDKLRFVTILVMYFLLELLAKH